MTLHSFIHKYKQAYVVGIYVCVRMVQSCNRILIDEQDCNDDMTITKIKHFFFFT